MITLLITILFFPLFAYMTLVSIFKPILTTNRITEIGQ